MSWLTDALDKSQKIIDATYDGIAKAKAIQIRQTFLDAYVKEAEQVKPTFANYANPDDMK